MILEDLMVHLSLKTEPHVNSPVNHMRDNRKHECCIQELTHGVMLANIKINAEFSQTSALYQEYVSVVLLTPTRFVWLAQSP
jgi:hypothetical protein